ncbi:hypothetical protein BT96DRAFT_943860 [Gymnopus androsaceus JB14]|uniref:Uncharacterized protein n=1 Tax=Gymnopus androsaceus JB14 TaxID=1447944 RepID=A0A6A4H870_9AGAR|nr:hypothetical protein BT96DRAFT_943860 [Gymnopus androsaceus JB14]
MAEPSETPTPTAATVLFEDSEGSSEEDSEDSGEEALRFTENTSSLSLLFAAFSHLKDSEISQSSQLQHTMSVKRYVTPFYSLSLNFDISGSNTVFRYGSSMRNTRFSAGTNSMKRKSSLNLSKKLKASVSVSRKTESIPAYPKCVPYHYPPSTPTESKCDSQTSSRASLGIRGSRSTLSPAANEHVVLNQQEHNQGPRPNPQVRALASWGGMI